MAMQVDLMRGLRRVSNIGRFRVLGFWEKGLKEEEEEEEALMEGNLVGDAAAADEDVDVRKEIEEMGIEKGERW